MDAQVAQIAERIRKIREENDLSIEWAAKALNVPVDELASYETGESDIPVSFLYMAAKKYGVELSALLTGMTPQEQFYSVTRRGEGVHVDRRKEYDYLSLCAEFARKKMEPMIVSVDPEEETKEAAFHSHQGQEFHYVIEGRLQIIINLDEIILEPGDSLMFNSEQPHALKALDNHIARFLVVLA